MTFFHAPVAKLPELVSQTSPEGKRFYTLPDGSKLPSVTTVLGAKPNFSIEKWKARVGPEEARKVSNIATTRGTGMHNMIETYLDNKSPKPGSNYHAWESFLSIKPLINRINVIHHIEACLWSKKVGMAGRVDTIAEFDGITSIIDYKSSKRIKKIEDIESYFVQTTAYALMYEDMTGIKVNQLVILMAVDHEKPLLFIQKPYDYVPKLIEALRYYKELNKQKQESSLCLTSNPT